jgi:SAM-dependent methyltransferase
MYVLEEVSSMTERKESWSDGAAYDPYMGRWSRLVAREFVGWLALPEGGRWLDVGCGTGALCRTILAVANPITVRGADQSAGYIAYARAQVVDDRMRFDVADARSLPYENDSYDAVVSGLVLNFVPDPGAVVAEMSRVARPGGTVATYVWDYAGEMQLMRRFWDVAVALNPAALELDEGQRFPICQPGPLRWLLEGSGLVDVETHAIVVPTVFRDFDDYWTPFLGGQAPAPGYAMSLTEEARAELRERLRATLPIAADGAIQLIARAWGVRGTKA